MLDAIVVGSGPNGLAAAVELARRGRTVTVFEGAETIGGGCRTAELLEPGHHHDICAAVHPLGVASPFLRSLPLDRFGLEWKLPEVQLSHPLGEGRAVGLLQPLAATAELLGADGEAYRDLMAPLVSRAGAIVDGALAPPQASWRRPLAMSRFGLAAIRSAEDLAARFDTETGRALVAGLGAHTIAALDAPGTAGVALVLALTAHRGGWPFAGGGSQSIVDALAAYLRELGGTIETGVWVESLEQLPTAGAVYLDTGPAAAVRIGGERADPRIARRLAKRRHGPGSHKVDWILDGPVPWTDPLSGRAGTVHVGGSFAEIAESEARAVAGAPPQDPFVLVAQPSVVDASRAPAGRHVVWGYCHVPPGYSSDATGAIETQIERFAPGFRDRIVARHTTTAAELAHYNPNYVGGDIGGGAWSLNGLLARPRLARNPYRIGNDLYLCSAAASPGPGVHGMCGYHAVDYALDRAAG